MTPMEEMAARILNPPRAPVPDNSDLSVCQYIAMCTSADDLGEYLHQLTFGDGPTQEMARLSIKLKVSVLQVGNGR